MLFDSIEVRQETPELELQEVARASLARVMPYQCRRCVKRPCQMMWDNEDSSCWHQERGEGLLD
ncbi:hypothetical protein Misp06_00794 [Microbulbifer sp. NBRC 101763]|uniref:hypothetical protein n=1 Tax=Microbulbifer sp. NBRC 101763 TaxID=1113820 RepID=UPI0030B17F57